MAVHHSVNEPLAPLTPTKLRTIYSWKMVVAFLYKFLALVSCQRGASEQQQGAKKLTETKKIFFFSLCLKRIFTLFLSLLYFAPCYLLATHQPLPLDNLLVPNFLEIFRHFRLLFLFACF